MEEISVRICIQIQAFQRFLICIQAFVTKILFITAYISSCASLKDLKATGKASSPQVLLFLGGNFYLLDLDQHTGTVPY
jgi:hypothetical protein